MSPATLADFLRGPGRRTMSAGNAGCDGEPFLPYNQPDIGEAEIEEVVATLRSGWLAPGPRVAEFERRFAGTGGAAHAVAVNSCTAGMHLALVGGGIGPGDEVITTPLTFAATVNVIIHSGATPVLADIEPDDLTLDPERVEAVLTPRTRAIIPVHHAGAACRMPELLSLARSRGLLVIEDAAHGLGTFVGERPVGSLGTATAFSFYATKNLATGEGGMVTTDDAGLAERMRMLSLHGLSRDAWERYTSRGSWYYQVLAPGYNYVMSDIQGALGLRQLDRLDEFQRRRRRLAERYLEALADLPELALPRERPGTTHAWHLFVVRLRTGDRDGFIERMRERGIGTSVHFIPLHLHPYYRETFGWERGDFPRAEEGFEGLVSLPLYTKMTEDDVERVARAVRETLHAGR